MENCSFLIFIYPRDNLFTSQAFAKPNLPLQNLDISFYFPLDSHQPFHSIHIQRVSSNVKGKTIFRGKNYY